MNSINSGTTHDFTPGGVQEYSYNTYIRICIEK